MCREIILVTICGSAAGVLIRLDGAWSVAGGNITEPVEASVPGTVPGALFTAGLRPDPHFGYSQNGVLDEMTASDFTYSSNFDTPAACRAPGARCELICDGVDTAADVAVNGVVVGSTENMHQRYVFDITEAVTSADVTSKQGNNIEIRIRSPTAYAKSVAASHGDPECKKVNRDNGWYDKFGHNTICSAYIRKNIGSFGWDCARAYATQGVWKSVWLRVVQGAVVDAVVPIINGTISGSSDSEIPSNEFDVMVQVHLSIVSSGSTTEYLVRVEGSWSVDASASKTINLQPNTTSAIVNLSLKAHDVALWWPNGEGKPVLHSLTTSLLSAKGVAIGVPVAQSVGFRTFELVGLAGTGTEKHRGKAPLWFKVNNRPVFSKGHNWMPGDVLTADDAADRKNKRDRLMDAVRVHANTVRIWGGGIYETSAFYDAADELGLMVLQDGSFFSAHYPKYERFYELVREEVRYNIRRLASHPSLVVYSGNNEGDVFGDIHLYVEEQLETVKAENPNVVVWPSCPSNGWESYSPKLVARRSCPDKACPHDDHYYGPCGTIPAKVQFGTEFGWPSADLYTVTAAITPDGQDFLRPATGGNEFLDYRSTIKNPDWTTDSMLIFNSTLVETFPTLLVAADATPLGLERWLYLTQALQQHCVGRSIEAYRQHDEVMGSLNWALNSIWTAPAWGSISHDGSWKMLHYHLRRVFEQVHLSFVYPVLSSSYRKPPANSTCASGHVCLHLSNHKHTMLQKGASCTLEVRDFAAASELHAVSFKAPAVDAVGGLDILDQELAPLFEAAGCDEGSCFLTATCTESIDQRYLAEPFFPTPLASCNLAPVDLDVHVLAYGKRELELEVSGNTTAPFLMLASTIAGRFDDNAFTLLPGDPRQLKFEADENLPAQETWESSVRIYTMNNKAPYQMRKTSSEFV